MFISPEAVDIVHIITIIDVCNVINSTYYCTIITVLSVNVILEEAGVENMFIVKHGCHA